MSSLSNLHRHSLRMEGYDYSIAGVYFITTVTYQRSCIFGDIESGEMKLNVFGQIIKQTWEWLSNHFTYVELDTYIVMPNHFHGIIKIMELDDSSRGGSRPAPTKIKALGQLIGAFKTVSAKKINQIRDTSGSPVWQRNYHDHIIRTQKEYESIWNYIEANPANWMDDQLKP